MTLQQLKYADAVAACGSISEAARRVFVTQPTLTESIRALEEELRTAIFTRSARGIAVTREGEEFLASARQILDDAARIQEKYTGKAVRKPQFAVSCQHYAFAVEAFMEVVKECDSAAYDFTLRETVTSEIIDDVARHRSEIGVLYLSTRNERVISKLLKNEGLKFEELFVSHPHVFLGKRHPLAKRKGGVARKKNIRVRDRATMTNLILGLNGFTVASGALSKELNGPEVVAVPLKMDEIIRVGLVTHGDVPLSAAGRIFGAAIRSRCAERSYADAGL